MMKTTFYTIVLLVFFVTCLTACSRKMQSVSSAACYAVAAGDTAVFAGNHSVSLFACDKSFTANIAKVNDSRCPVGVQCVWAGTASVVFQLTDHSDIILDLNKTKEVNYQNYHYSFTLVNVMPYPAADTTVSPENQKAIVRIIRK